MNREPRCEGCLDLAAQGKKPVTTQRVVGVLGGMGPAATVDFMAKVVALTPATCDQDHVPLIVHQVPQIADRSSAVLQGSDAPLGPMLVGLRRLARAGAQLAVIPCNTAHYWYERLVRMQKLSILHIADAVRQELERRTAGGGRCVAILATRGMHRAGVYTGRLGQHFEPVLPVDAAVQRLVDRSICATKAGEHRAASLAAQEAADRMLSRGADVLILACTELPLALADSAEYDACIDSTLALARLCVDEAVRVRPERPQELRP